MKTYLHIFVLASSVVFISTSPASNSLTADEGSGDGPEIVINDVAEKNVDTDNDNSMDESSSAADPADLLDMEMNPEDNEVNDNSVNEVENKLDNKKCKKCIRGHYRLRHGDFCGSCEKKMENKDEKKVEKKPINLQNRCKRCARKNFKARNEDFCADDCSTVDMNTPTEKKHNKKEQDDTENEETTQAVSSTTEAETTTKVAVMVEEPVEVTEKDMKKDNKLNEKKNKNKRKPQKPNKKDKKKKNKNKKHTEKNQEVMKEEENKEEDILSKVVVESLEDPEEHKDSFKLGPLENLIKFLINSNTYTH